ncbi:MAG TPA: hypothetical protein VIU64_20935 [Polyangia bacterium]
MKPTEGGKGAEVSSDAGSSGTSGAGRATEDPGGGGVTAGWTGVA